jgi:hypothetical protein
MLSAEETRPARSLSSCWNIDLLQKRKIFWKENPFIHFARRSQSEHDAKRERGKEKNIKRQRDKEGKRERKKERKEIFFYTFY